jgi:hypothetical protein
MIFIPDDNHPEGGLFWLATQTSEQIYIYQLPLLSSTDDTSSILIDTFIPIPGLTRYSALSYYEETNHVLAILDRWLIRIDATTHVVDRQWPLGWSNPEGVVAYGSTVYFACDLCGEIWKFDTFNIDSGVHTGKCHQTPGQANDLNGLRI